MEGESNNQEKKISPAIEKKDQACKTVQSALFEDASIQSSKYAELETELQKAIEDRYQKGDRLIAKNGVIWTWKAKDGSQKGEVIPAYITYRRALIPKLQTKVFEYLNDTKKAEEIRQRVAGKKEKLENIKKIDIAKKQVPDAIRKDFPQMTDESKYAKFWGEIYGFIEEGFTGYKLAEEFMKKVKITNPALRKKVSESGFILTNNKTKELILCTGDTSEKVVVDTKDIKPERTAEDEAFNAETGRLFEEYRNNVPGSFEKSMDILNQLASKNSDLQKIHEEIKEYILKGKDHALTAEEMKKTEEIGGKFRYLMSINPQDEKIYQKYGGFAEGFLGD